MAIKKVNQPIMPFISIEKILESCYKSDDYSKEENVSNVLLQQRIGDLNYNETVLCDIWIDWEEWR